MAPSSSPHLPPGPSCSGGWGTGPAGAALHSWRLAGPWVVASARFSTELISFGCRSPSDQGCMLSGQRQPQGPGRWERVSPTPGSARMGSHRGRESPRPFPGRGNPQASASPLFLGAPGRALWMGQATAGQLGPWAGGAGTGHQGRRSWRLRQRESAGSKEGPPPPTRRPCLEGDLRGLGLAILRGDS